MINSAIKLIVHICIHIVVVLWLSLSAILTSPYLCAVVCHIL